MKTKFILATLVLSLLVVASIAAANAAVGYNTVIAGKIYDGPDFETASGVEGANVNVTCNGNVKTTTSLDDGTYSVIFTETECPGDSTGVLVVAEKDGVSNSGTGNVHDYTSSIGVYLGVVNVALIPEFGLVIGALTLVSAIGVFFFVRRK